MTDNSDVADGYVRIPVSELPTVELHHLVSKHDTSIVVSGQGDGDATVTGYTEWVGTWRTQSVSVGWDWGVIHGAVIVLNPSEIRTNILLLADDLSAESRDRATIHLLDWIESMPWRDTAVRGE